MHRLIACTDEAGLTTLRTTTRMTTANLDPTLAKMPIGGTVHDTHRRIYISRLACEPDRPRPQSDIECHGKMSATVTVHRAPGLGQGATYQVVWRPTTQVTFIRLPRAADTGATTVRLATNTATTRRQPGASWRLLPSGDTSSSILRRRQDRTA